MSQHFLLSSAARTISLKAVMRMSEDEARDCAEGTFNPRLFPLLWAYYERKVKLD